MSAAWIAARVSLSLFLRPLAGAVTLGWLALLELTSGAGSRTLSAITSLPTAPSYHVLFQAVGLGMALGLVSSETSLPPGSSRLRSPLGWMTVAALGAPALLLALLSLPHWLPPVRAAQGGPLAAGSMSLLLLVAGCGVLRVPASGTTRALLYLSAYAVLALTAPRWFSGDWSGVQDPLGSPILPILGSMLALWLHQPSRTLDR